jgi:hypothetical protein
MALTDWQANQLVRVKEIYEELKRQGVPAADAAVLAAAIWQQFWTPRPVKANPEPF